MGSRYEKLDKDSVTTIDPKTEILKFICCDCGLVHYIHIEKKNGLFHISSERDCRSTAQFRRRKWGYLHEGIGKWILEERKP